MSMRGFAFAMGALSWTATALIAVGHEVAIIRGFWQFPPFRITSCEVADIPFSLESGKSSSEQSTGD